MHADQLPITGPCPIDLDAIGFDRDSRVSHCTHCAKNVTILSNMTRGEARSFLREHKGQTMCVSYARDAEGRIRFRPEPEVVAEPVLVPVSRLRARPSRRAGLVAALGVSAALAACAPHGEPPREVSIPAKVAKPETTKVEVEGPKPDAVPMAGAAVIPEEPMVEGEIEVPDPEQMVDGEMRVPDPEAIDEPCDGTSKAKVEAEALHARR